MTNKQDLRGSKCSTLTDERREQIERDHRRDREQRPSFCGHLTFCGQRLWDSDNYLARSFGTLYKKAYSYEPLAGQESIPVRLDWCDHGTTTHYFVGGYHVGQQPTARVAPRIYLESIWSAGRHIARHLASEWRDRQERSR